ncbi:MAG: adenosylcobinamide-phosphate synthase CbiB, partial [Acidimicrobiales bacterium]|nr:adenosylcobinamide-phosphate synthase CbiB [Acidimicrobiales bacterium]
GGLAIDALAGEPPLQWHPVAHFGTIMAKTERCTYADRRINGVLHLAVGVGLAAVAGWGLQRLLGRRVGTAAAVALCAAGRMLDCEAEAVAVMLRAEDLGGARRRLRSLAGRDAEDLDARELARAVIESVAENLSDAVTATLWWGSVGGPVAVSVHRAINTLDAMIGYRDDRYGRFGWAAARADDLVNFLPARLTALAVAAARPARARAVWRIVRRDAHRHPSPNAGIVEAAFAAVLGLQLGGVNRYGAIVDDRGTLGDGRRPDVNDIDAAVRLRRDATLVFAAALLIITEVLHRLRWRNT